MDAETKGERAAVILESEVYQDAIEGAKQRIKDTWAGAKAEVEREALWHKHQAIDAVTTELRIIRDRGILERTTRERKESK